MSMKKPAKTSGEVQGTVVNIATQNDDGYQSLLGKISQVYATGQVRATQAVNVHITETYWQIGHDIVEFEQEGKARAINGKGLLELLSRDLSLRHGKGFSRSNLSRFRQFYLAYPICATLSHKLSWSMISEFLKIEDPLERSFYEQQAIREKWAVRELQRQMKTSLFLRLAAGKDKDAILQLASEGQILTQPADLLRDPYIFEFLNSEQRRATCRIRHLRNEQPALRPEIPTLPSRPRRTPP